MEPNAGSTNPTYKQSKSAEKFSKFFLIPQRFILVIMGLLSIVNAYTMRISLSHAIIYLVVPKNNTEESENPGYCPNTDPVTSESPTQHGDNDWSEAMQGFILGSFYIGYVISHVPGGILADKYGGKWVLSLGILSTALFTILTPIVVHALKAPGLITLRVLMGLGEGTTFPSLSVLLAGWAPAKERAKMGTVMFSGIQMGTIVSNTCSGLMLHSLYWSNLFYIFGSIAVLWFLIFTALCYSYPATHPFIKQKEREYLQNEIGNMSHKKKPPPPWKQILKNKPVWALIICQVGHDWGFYVMVTNLPKYMADVMQFSITSNGFYTSLPFLCMWVSAILCAILSDFLIARRYMSITKARKLMTFTSALGPGVFMVAASYAGCNRTLVVAMFTLSVGLMGPHYAGMKLGPMDMSPNYAGFLMAISNGLGATTGLFSPALAGLLTPNATLEEWRRVFWIAFAVLLLTGIVYLFWASGEIQPFDAHGNVEDEPPEEKNTSAKKEGKK